jgi:phenylalanyl-tRNA synthetase beta chain
MKISTSWLREWVPVTWEPRELGARLTMAGFELEALTPAAPPFSGVLVAEILEAVPHPQADKLRVCRVASGHGAPLQVVCGASNARAGLRSALATVGARLPGELNIAAAKIRGVESHGMLCSAKELGLADASGGILELPADAPIGTGLREYLDLDDAILELNVTPNRGDAMSVLGIAREVAALNGRALGPARFDPVSQARDDVLEVSLDAPAACPRFAGRVIRGIDPRATAPLWMRERLRRAGLRSISLLVDVTNYVLIELGQPMHAYDLAKVAGTIRVRMARPDEAMTLLDGRAVTLAPDMLAIADADGAIGVGGIMGGERTAVSASTVDVFLEAAHFTPQAIAGRARRLGLQTDASQRFERGVDPLLPERAIERATALITASGGGSPGPLTISERVEALPLRRPVRLRRAQLARLLGANLEAERVESVFKALQMNVAAQGEGWSVTPPSHRFDIAIEADLIEEVARIIGYETIPETASQAAQHFAPLPESAAPERAVLETLAARGYHEVITFAFVDPQLQQRLFPSSSTLALANPIASDLSVMRVSLWPGLVRATLENQHRQIDRIRLFEHGARFAVESGATREIDTLAGLALGPRGPEQWGATPDGKASVDFFDLKADLEALLAATGEPEAFGFEAATLACLHPGRTARVVRRGEAEGTGGAAVVGWIGELHPSLVRELGFAQAPVLFELDFAAGLDVRLPRARAISRFPQVRRDIAVVVDEMVTLSALRERVTLVASSLLRDLRVFDIYRGPGIEEGRKSVALGLIFQEISRTLTDEDADRMVASVVADLRANLGARIRE